MTAGPGAGKTEFLAQRAGYLLETGICRPPQQILAISFKRDAATNLRRRVEARLPEHASRFTSMTFDAFTKSIVDRFTRLLPQEWAFEESYKIGFSSRAEIEAFLGDIASSAPDGLQGEVHAISAFTFLPNVLGAAELLVQPSKQPPPTTAREYAVQEWWARNYLGRTNPVVDFVMLNRLADLMIRTSPQLQRALRATYPFVFVDEFQDTTYAQYSFLKSVFAVTARPSPPSAIASSASWAGPELSVTRSPSSSTTSRPSRSPSSRISAPPSSSSTSNTGSPSGWIRRPSTRTPGSSRRSASRRSRCGRSATAEREADAIAAWIASDIEQSGRQPSEFALIARQKVADLEPALTEALHAVGLQAAQRRRARSASCACSTC